MKKRKLTRVIAMAMTTTLFATSVMTQETVLGAQTDSKTEEAANEEQTKQQDMDIPAVGSKVTKVTTDCETEAKKSTDWRLVWSDEFNDGELDTTKWDYQFGDGSDYGVAGWGNAEKQYYTKGDNITFEDGHLVITAKKENKGNSTYTSAKLWTEGNDYYNGTADEPLFAKKYGRIEAKMSLPSGTGYWPAFWMMPLDDEYGGWASSGEIDIMEARGRVTGSVDGTIHFGNSWPNNKSRGGQYDTTIDPSFNFTEEHEYALEWTPGKISWLVDNQCYKTITNWYSIGSDNKENFTYPAPFDQEFFIMLNLAVGGNYDGGNLDESIDGGQMKVDYVRVYDLLDDNGEVHDYSEDEKTVESEAAQAGGLEGGVVGETNFLSGDLKDAVKITEHKEGIEGWYLQTGTGGSANVSATEDGAKVSISAVGDNNYSVQLMHQFPLTYGYEYELKFDAKADEARSITAQAGDFTYNFLGSWTKYSDAFTVPLITEWKTYTYKFDMKEFNDDYARLELNLGLTSNASVYFRNASLVATGLYHGLEEDDDKEPTKAGEHIYNGTFDQGNNKDANGEYTRLKFWNVKEGAKANVNKERQLVLESGTGENAGIEQTGISLLGKDRYQITFDASALSGDSVKVQVTSASGTEYASEVIDLTSDTQKKTVTFTVPENASDKTGSIAFIVGKDGTKVIIDNISMKRLTNYNVDYSNIKVYPIENGDFAGCNGKELKGWSTYGNPDVDVTDGVCTVTAVPSGNVWDKMLIADAMQMEEGMTYELHFEQKAEREGEPYTAKIETTDGSYTVVAQKACETTTDWTEEDLTFTCGTSGVVEFKYLLAQVASECKISFRNVKLCVANAPIMQMPFFYRGELAKADQDTVFQMHLAKGTEDAWRNAEKTVTVDGNKVDAVFDETASTMTIPGAVVSKEGTYKIKVSAPGFDLCEFSLAVYPSGKNLVLNGGFSSGAEYWTNSYFNEGEGYPAGKLNITDAQEAKIDYNWAQNFWDLQLIQKNIPLKKGKEYKVTFDARATVDRPISLSLAGTSKSYKLGSKYHTYTSYVTAAEDGAEIAFMLGNVTMGKLTTPSESHSVYFDNITIEEMDEENIQKRIPDVESAGSVKLTQDVVLNLANVENAWNEADKTVYVNETAVAAEDLSWDDNKVTISNSVFHQTGDYEIVIKANGFADTNTVFQQILSAGIQEYITNGDFSEGGTNWNFWAGGVPASANVRYKDGQAQITMTYAWKNDFGGYASWGIQFNQNVFLSKDKEYVLKFKAGSELAKQLDLEVSGQKGSFALTNEEQEFTYQFKANDENATVAFFFGACLDDTPEETPKHTMWLKDVSLTELGDEALEGTCVYQVEHYIEKNGKYVLYERSEGAAKENDPVDAAKDGICRNYEGYTFEPEAEGSVVTGTASDQLVLKLFYKANRYKIDYVMNLDSDVENSNPDTYVFGQVLTLSKPSCKGKEFLGWYFDEDCLESAEAIPSNMTGDVVLYAKWKDAEPEPDPTPDSGKDDTENTEKPGKDDTETPGGPDEIEKPEPDPTPDPGKDDTENTEKPGKDDTESTEKPGKDDTESTEKPGKDDTESTEKPGKDDTESTEKPGKDDTESTEKPGKGDTESTEKPGKDDTAKPGIDANVKPGTGNTETSSPENVAVSELILNENQVTLNKGAEFALTVKVSPDNATNKNIVFSSDNENIALVSAEGMIKAVGKGTANITVRTADGTVSAVCTVTVTVPAGKITLNTKDVYVVKGKKVNLKATMSPLDCTDKIVWSSSKKSVATVKNGKITAKKTGTAVITAKTTSGKKVTCKVHVVKTAKKAASVTLNKKQLTMKTGNTYDLKAKLKPFDSTDIVKWKSSNKKVVTVDEFGTVTAKKSGNVKITATTSSGKKVTCVIKVKK